MENTRIAGQAREVGAPLTDAEEEQAGYALRELVRSESGPDALRVPRGLLKTVQPFFELGWALGVRTGHTGPAMADVPVDEATVNRAFVTLLSERIGDHLAHTVARSLAPESAGPVLWQKARYHGSLTRRHGTYWVHAIHAHADPLGGYPDLRYDLCKIRGLASVPMVSNVRRESLTPLPEFRTWL